MSKESVDGNYFIDLMGSLLHPLRLVLVKDMLRLFEFDRECQILKNNQKLNEYILSKGHIVQLKFQQLATDQKNRVETLLKDGKTCYDWAETYLFTGQIFGKEGIVWWRDRFDVVQLIVGEDVQSLISVLQQRNKHTQRASISRKSGGRFTCTNVAHDVASHRWNGLEKSSCKDQKFV